MTRWRCVKNCGACCYLDPAERPGLEDYLAPEELTHYLSLVGEEGWCIHFDPQKRECRIYEDRPEFCRVRRDTFERMYEIDESEFDEFAIACCIEQIEWRYGANSPEMLRYDREVGM
jgi:uncharacterized protein